MFKAVFLDIQETLRLYTVCFGGNESKDKKPDPSDKTDSTDT